MGYHFLLQGTFLSQGSNSYLLPCQSGSLPLSHQRNTLFLSTRCYFKIKSVFHYSPYHITELCLWENVSEWCLITFLDFFKVKSLSHVQLFATPWTIAHQAPPSMEFSGQEYWSEVPFPFQGIFLTQGLNPGLLHCKQTLPSEPPGNPKLGGKSDTVECLRCCPNYKQVSSTWFWVFLLPRRPHSQVRVWDAHCYRGLRHIHVPWLPQDNAYPSGADLQNSLKN